TAIEQSTEALQRFVNLGKGGGFDPMLEALGVGGVFRAGGGAGMGLPGGARHINVPHRTPGQIVVPHQPSVFDAGFGASWMGNANRLAWAGGQHLEGYALDAAPEGQA